MLHLPSHPLIRRSPGLALVALVVAACSAEPEPGAIVGDVAIPADELAALGEPEQRSLFDLVAFGAATANGSTDSLSAPMLERAQLLGRLEVLPFYLGARSSGMDETMVESIYRANPDWELEVRHVVRLVESDDPATVRDSARTVAQQVEAEARAGADFAALAARYSEEPGAARRGGLLEPGRRGSWVDPFWEAALALEPGETSPVVESEYGYHVLKLDDRRPVPFAEADQAAFYRRAVPVDFASGAMSQWVEENGEIEVDAVASAAAARELAGDGHINGATVLASGGGVSFDGADLIAGWAALSPDARRSAERDPTELERWLREEARQIIWAKKAREIGTPAPAGSTTAAEWQGSFARWANLFGFREGMSPEEVYQAARQAVLSGAAETRAGRDELRSLRPVLRAAYPTDFAAG